ncbi:MAG: hypothetical protein ACM3PP_13525 [Candidatus Saccharibacteria bacterium]
MSRAIVSVKRIMEAQAFDLEVPTDLNSEVLSSIISELLGWNYDREGRKVYYRIEVKPPGKIMQPAENLDDIGAMDGSWLVFHEM